MFARRIATGWIALAVLTAGIGTAMLEARPAHAATVPAAPDRSLSPAAGLRVGMDRGGPVAVRPGASDVPRVYPLVSEFRNAVRAA